MERARGILSVDLKSDNLRFFWTKYLNFIQLCKKSFFATFLFNFFVLCIFLCPTSWRKSVETCVFEVWHILVFLFPFRRWPAGLEHFFHQVELESGLRLVLCQGEVVDHVEVADVGSAAVAGLKHWWNFLPFRTFTRHYWSNHCQYSIAYVIPDWWASRI